jgi:hypothetical protein
MAGETAETVILAGRGCGACSLCCKLLRIDEFQKPEGQWCIHCAPGKGGCKIYNNRPNECREFYCAWLTVAELGPEWFPFRSKIVVYFEGDGNRIALHVDPASPTVWLEEPYYSQIKEWAIMAAEQNKQVIIYVKNRVIAVLPNKEVDLGVMRRGDHIMVASTKTAQGKDWRAFIVPAKDVTPENAQKWVRWKKPNAV